MYLFICLFVCNYYIIYLFIIYDLLFIIRKSFYFMLCYHIILLRLFFVWGLGIGDWGLPNPQSPIPNPQIFYLFL